MNIDYYKKIIDIIQTQFDSMPEFNKSVEVFDEQVYMTKIAVGGNPMKRDKYYVIVKFGSSSSNFWQINLPFSLQILCEKNKFEEAKYLFTQYTLKYNVTDIFIDEGYRYLQYYQTPVVSRSFADIGNGFYTMLSMNGQFLFGLGTDFISQIVYKSGNEQENIKFLSVDISLNNSLDSQPFPNLTNDPGSYQLLKSVSKYGALALGLSTFLIKNSVLTKDLKKMLKPSTRNLNKDFEMYILFADEIEGFTTVKSNEELPATAEVNDIVFWEKTGNFYKCTGKNILEEPIWTIVLGDKFVLKFGNFRINQKLGELTSVSVSFTH